jgi:hypothetical protein
LDFDDDSSSSSSFEFKSQDKPDFELIKQQKANTKTEKCYKLLRKLADAIYQDERPKELEESKDEVMKYAPDMSLK